MLAKGRLRHRFHGTYSAVLVLGFDSPEAAAAALPIVGEAFAVTTDPRAIVAVMTAEDLDAFKAKHAARIAILPCGFRHCSRTLSRCKATAIDALTHSVDVGPAFTFNAGELPEAPRKVRAPRKPRKPAKPTTCADCGAIEPAFRSPCSATGDVHVTREVRTF